jgi:hypothetical protein
VKAGEGSGGVVECAIERDGDVKYVVHDRGAVGKGEGVVGYKVYLLRSSGDTIETGRAGNVRDSVELWGLMCSTSMTFSFVNGAWLMFTGLEMRCLKNPSGLLARDDV